MHEPREALALTAAQVTRIERIQHELQEANTPLLEQARLDRISSLRYE